MLTVLQSKVRRAAETQQTGDLQVNTRPLHWPLLAAALLAVPFGLAVAASPAHDEPMLAGKGSDSPSHPLGDRQAALRARALEAKLQGKAKGKKHEVAKGQFVELELEGTDRVFVVIAEFGDDVHPSYGGAVGPRHNQIAEPDRSVDNSTIWQADYDKAHYEDMYFNRMVDYYRKQSSGRYTINGDVTEWVRVPFNEARYGTNACGGIVCSTVWVLVRDAINVWTADQLAAGKTPAQVKAYLDTFDVWDRYDYDGDGNFDEQDGYIDHFQIVHAGAGEETGGGAQGADAIWSHRWYAYFNQAGVAGPSFNKLGGTQFGATDMWVGDYTIQPENGGLGVFAHEYAHDLGLPDQYDTAGGSNSTGFWTIMSSGSYLSDGTTDIGSRPGDFNAWEKFQLGWLRFEVAVAGARSEHKLGPAETNTKQAQGLFVVLPDKEVTTSLAEPFEGSNLYYSGAGDDIDNSMGRSVTLPAGVVTLAAKANYQIEFDWDYAYLTVNGTPVPTSLSTASNPNGQNFGNGITGSSGGAWVNLSADLSAYAGQTVTIGFRYWTDGAVVEQGFMVDAISITGQPFDGAESAAGWAYAGYRVSTGIESEFFFNAYVAEFRQYRTYDTGLKTGPYNFGFGGTRPDWVERYAYQDGMLVSYWDTSYSDNNTSQHAGGGLVLPVDAHPNAVLRSGGAPWGSRIQAYDSTFGLEATDAMTLHFNDVPSEIPSLPAVPVFNDTRAFWDPSTPLANVQVPKTGTSIRVKSVSAQGGFMQVQVAPTR
jgi:immune inhibitor A